MSLRIMSAVWGAATSTAAQRLVLLRLADHADAKGDCWPSQESLCAACDLSPRAVRDALNALEISGHISITQRTGKGNRHGYHIHPKTAAEIPANLAGISGDSNRQILPVIPANPAGSNRQILPVCPPPPYIEEPSIEPPRTPKAELFASPWVVAFGIELPPAFQTQPCLEAVNLWLQHKREKGDAYKPTGLMTTLKKWAKEFTATQLPDAIENAISRNWKGVFQINGNGFGSNSATSPAKPHPRNRYVAGHNDPARLAYNAHWDAIAEERDAYGGLTKEQWDAAAVRDAAEAAASTGQPGMEEGRACP